MDTMPIDTCLITNETDGIGRDLHRGLAAEAA
jgi:hypothetical protein